MGLLKSLVRKEDVCIYHGGGEQGATLSVREAIGMTRRGAGGCKGMGQNYHGMSHTCDEFFQTFHLLLSLH